jgi:hypothetical protein
MLYPMRWKSVLFCVCTQAVFDTEYFNKNSLIKVYEIVLPEEYLKGLYFEGF